MPTGTQRAKKPTAEEHADGLFYYACVHSFKQANGAAFIVNRWCVHRNSRIVYACVQHVYSMCTAYFKQHKKQESLINQGVYYLCVQCVQYIYIK